MKKTLTFVMACVLLVSLFSNFVFADDLDTDEPPIITEEYTYLANCWAGLKSTGGGWYNVTGGAGSALNDVTISVTVILQKSNPQSITGWDDLYTWTNSAKWSASAGGSWYIASSGTYRTHVIAEVYKNDGSLGESETANSDHLIIP